MTVIDVLRAARSRIEANWSQGDVDGYVSHGKYCMSTALCDLASSAEQAVARRLLRTAIGAKLLVPWNDAPGRTQAEALAAFDRAIALAGTAMTEETMWMLARAARLVAYDCADRGLAALDGSGVYGTVAARAGMDAVAGMDFCRAFKEATGSDGMSARDFSTDGPDDYARAAVFPLLATADFLDGGTP